MDLNKSDLAVKSWNWAFGYLKKQIDDQSAEIEQITTLIQGTALLTPFVEAITLSEDNSMFVVSFKDTGDKSDKDAVQRFAALDESCRNGSITVPEYFTHLVEGKYSTIVILLEGEDGRYNYREYCGVQLQHVIKGNGLDPNCNADYQLAFTLSDFHDVFVNDCGPEIIRVGAIDIGSEQRFINPLNEAASAIAKTSSLKGKMRLSSSMAAALRKGKRKR